MSSSSKSSHGRRGITIAALALIVCAVFTVRFISLGRGSIPESIETVQAREGIPVEAVSATLTDLESWTTLAGTVEGIIQYPIVSNNALRVQEIHVMEGDAVHQGDVILRLAHEAPTPMIHSYQKARASYDNAVKNYRRLRNLHEEGAISTQALDLAETQMKVAEADLRNAEESTSLIASKDGIVTSITTRAGDTVGAGKALVWIARTDSVKICFEAGSRQALTLQKGQPARWEFTGAGIGGEGVISRLDLMADPKTHLLSGEALFPNPGEYLVPGMLVSFQVRTMDVPEALVVPTACLIETSDGHELFTVQGHAPDLRALRRRVEVGQRTTDLVQILEGLDARDQTIRFGLSKIEDGSKIHLIDDREES